MLARTLLSGPFVEPFAPDHGEAWSFAYGRRARGRYRHVVALRIAPGLDDMLTASLLRGMRSNAALEGLTRGRHYQWGGLSTIGFRAKEAAALFIMFSVVD